MSREATKLFPGSGGAVSALGILGLDSGTAKGVRELGLNQKLFGNEK